MLKWLHMAKNGKRNDKYDKKFSSGLKTETKHGIVAVVFFVFALFFLMSMPPFKIAGVAGQFVTKNFIFCSVSDIFSFRLFLFYSGFHL